MVRPRGPASHRWAAIPLPSLVFAVLILLLLPSFSTGAFPPRSPGGSAPAHQPTLAAATLGAREVQAAQASLAGPVTLNSTGSPAWTNITPSTGGQPPARSYGRSFAWDPLDGYVLMFGGDGNAGYLADTWAFHDGTWHHLNPKTSPSARDHSTLAWDPVANDMVLFGGSGNSGAYSDTWTFVGGNWTQVTESTHPSARWASSLTWDAADQEMVLFGGCAGAAVGDTWTFSSNVWTQLHPTKSPSPRENVVLQYDAAIASVVLFGGDNYASNYYQDTWTFAAGNWTQQSPAVSPGARTQAASAYDPALGAVVVFGGMTLANDNGDTWLYAGGTWTAISLPVPPPARSFGMMAYDPAENGAVMWGGSPGLVDTWLLYESNLEVSASTTSGGAPLTVAFNATLSGGRGAMTIAWDLGDGNTSSLAAPVEVYTDPGRYQPSVRVVDANGSAASASLTLRVSWPFNVSASAGPLSGEAPLTVQATTLAQGGTGPYRYEWTAGNGNTSTSPAPTFIYGISGGYQLSVTVSDAAGHSFNESWVVTVTPRPPPTPVTASVFASVSLGVAPLTVQFAAVASGGAPPYSYHWSYGDGNTSIGVSPTYTFQTAGTYHATVSVIDGAGHSGNATVAVEVLPRLWASATTPLEVRLPNPVDFVADVGGGTAPYLYLWEFGDNSAGSVLNTTHVYPAAGNYTASLRVTDASGNLAVVQVPVVVQAAQSTVSPPVQSSGGSSSIPSVDVIAGSAVFGVLVGAIVAAVLLGRRAGGRTRP